MSLRTVVSTLTVLAAIQGSAFAQGTNGSSQASNQNTQATNQAAQPLPQEIKQKLQKQGFSDINVVPGSFIVSAKDSNNDPVTMVIGPHSLTMFTEVENTGQTTGSNARSGHSAGSGTSDSVHNNGRR